MRRILLICAFLTAFLSLGCRSAEADGLKSEIEKSLANETPSQTRTVNFEGVSFNYNPQVFELRSESVIHESPLQNESDKPGAELPKHIAFKFYIRNKLIEPEATIKIIPIADYRRMYAVSENYTNTFDKKIDDLRKILKDEKYRDENEIPFLEFHDAHQTIEAKVKHFSFQNGKGILFLSQINQDLILVNNEMLTYYFQSITNDGKYYILGEFPVSVSFLPNDWRESKFESYNLPSCCPYTAEGLKQYKVYVSSITKRLENLPQNEFQPNLKYVEEIISSLKVE